MHEPHESAVKTGVENALAKKVTRRDVLKIAGVTMAGLFTGATLTGCSEPGPGREIYNRHKKEWKIGGKPEIYAGTLVLGSDIKRRTGPWVETKRTTKTNNFAYTLNQGETEIVENPIFIRDGGAASDIEGERDNWIAYYSEKQGDIVWVNISFATVWDIKTPIKYDNVKRCTITKADFDNNQAFCDLNGSNIQIGTSKIEK